jgi:hypothetical protein
MMYNVVFFITIFYYQTGEKTSVLLFLVRFITCSTFCIWTMFKQRTINYNIRKQRLLTKIWVFKVIYFYKDIMTTQISTNLFALSVWRQLCPRSSLLFSFINFHTKKYVIYGPVRIILTEDDILTSGPVRIILTEDEVRSPRSI